MHRRGTGGRTTEGSSDRWRFTCIDWVAWASPIGEPTQHTPDSLYTRLYPSVFGLRRQPQPAAGLLSPFSPPCCFPLAFPHFQHQPCRSSWQQSLSLLYLPALVQAFQQDLLLRPSTCLALQKRSTACSQATCIYRRYFDSYL